MKMRGVTCLFFALILGLFASCSSNNNSNNDNNVESSDAALKATSSVKGVTVTSLGTPNSTLADAVAGAVTITAAEAADTSNTGNFITLFSPTNSGATVKVVKYASGGNPTNFITDTAYANQAITTLDFFIIKITAQDATTVLYYKTVITVTPLPVAIGDSYLGGIVAYILQSGDPDYDAAVQHGLIAATADQSTGIVWAIATYQGASVPLGTLTAIGSGSANTNHIIAQNVINNSTYAASIARAYNGGGYTDWYLPSRDELAKLYAMHLLGFGGFAGDNYWSSSELNASNAWYQDFGAGILDSDDKGLTYHVRAVRAF